MRKRLSTIFFESDPRPAEALIVIVSALFCYGISSPVVTPPESISLRWLSNIAPRVAWVLAIGGVAALHSILMLRDRRARFATLGLLGLLWLYVGIGVLINHGNAPFLFGIGVSGIGIAVRIAIQRNGNNSHG